ncbi:YgiQ family radical SAM protein [Candidatus Velamenicoccus archaeovorus]|nr:YgiQ family radical SAM protein [Candidatus Velamenicoccus archaeovorus]
MEHLLPTNKEEMRARGWSACDVIFVMADAYCDHPSFGVALLGRFLESLGYRVGIIAQPDWKKDADFLKLGRPELFFGVTAGNLDSMLAIYTSGMSLRKEDKYSPGGARGLRPRLPTIVYTQKLRQLFAGTPVVIGGLEASLRRLSYYDFWTDAVRRSILFDAKADMLVYGMGERPVTEIASRLKAKEKIDRMDDIRGTVIVRKTCDGFDRPVVLPSFEEVRSDKKKFVEAFNLYSKESNPFTARVVAQETDTRFCIQLPPALPLTQDEMDSLYSLPFSRRCHPDYMRYGGVPALKTVEASIVSHRGCLAACSFCSLSLHQGKVIQGRSAASLVQEASKIAGDRKSKGVITDVGGSTANMYAASCSRGYRCSRTDCLWPEVCPNLELDFKKQAQMLESVRRASGVRQVHIQSGMRYELLLLPQAREYFRLLCRYFISGQLKIAPEHVADAICDLMHKPRKNILQQFSREYAALNKELGKKQYLAQYFITAHPGCGPKEAEELAAFTRTMGYTPRQIQDFIPLPMTRSSCMYYTGLDPETGRPLYVARSRHERLQQRRMVQGAKLLD